MNEEKHPLPAHKLRIKKLKSLLAIVENSIKGGKNHFFRNMYAEENGKEIDIFENGSNSCAAFVSIILLALELIKHPHATVYSTEKDMLNSGWMEIKDLRPGAVIIWESLPNAKMLGESKPVSRHLGFFVGNNEAISNDSHVTGFPKRHSATFDGTRKIEKIYWHPALEDLN